MTINKGFPALSIIVVFHVTYICALLFQDKNLVINIHTGLYSSLGSLNLIKILGQINNLHVMSSFLQLILPITLGGEKALGNINGCKFLNH